MGFPPYFLGLGIPLLVGLVAIGLHIFNQGRYQPHHQQPHHQQPHPRQKKISFYKETDEDCPICLDKMTDKDSSPLKACGHRLHNACLVELFSRNQHKCPQCRAVIVYE